jgi:hypothetical protein
MLRINALGGLFVAKDGRVLAGAAAQPRRLAILDCSPVPATAA